MLKILWVVALLMMIVPASIRAEDVEISLHETVLNTLIGVLAPASGSGETDTPIGKKSYTWKLRNPRLSVQSDGLVFSADTRVSISGFTYDTVVNGRATAKINNKDRKIEMQVTNASFKLQLDVFGNKIHITDVDVSPFVNQKFDIETPKFSQTVTIPADGSPSAKALYLETGTPNIGYSPPFLVIKSPLKLEQVAPK